MATNASDIITYIGVPLAVLGVLPIIYTCIRALLVLRSIRRALARNGHSDSAVTRGSMMSGIVEVELPRCTITPLDRDHDPAYWKMNPERSSLKGGTWTYVHWNRLVTGKKLYRIQYKDELRVPQAEIEFYELVSFLLDRGAVPDEKGWSMLRTSGLWTPSGTVLLRPPPGKFGGALRIGIPDDSDGVLSLKLHWSSDWDTRDRECLPPFWMRIYQPSSKLATDMCLARESSKPDDCIIKIDEDSPTGSNDGDRMAMDTEGPTSQTTGNPQVEINEGKEEGGDSADQETTFALLALIEEKRAALHGETNLSDSMRFCLEGDNIEKLYFENSNSLTGTVRDFSSLPDIVAQWFVYVASSLGQIEKSGTWHFVVPADILHPTQRDAIPCGIMEILGIMQEHEVPHWSKPKPIVHDTWKMHRRFMENQRQATLERSMPPAQAEAARRAREQANMWSMQDDFRETKRLEREYQETRLTEAVNSRRLSNKIIAEACVSWLIDAKDIPKDYKVADVARSLLYLMVFDAERAQSTAEICDRWIVWAKGGPNILDITQLQENITCFCYAAAVIYTIQLASQSDGKVSTHMQECLGLWKKVRLG